MIDTLSYFDEVYIYMPTWRDADPNFIERTNLDFDAINEVLAARNAVLVLKLHVATPRGSVDRLRGLSNLFVMKSTDDVYPILPVTTGLITDYSSVYLDYLRLNRPICFFVFDLANYLAASRGFYHHFEDFAPGVLARDASAFLSFIDYTDRQDNFEAARLDLARKLFDSADGNASKRIVEFLKFYPDAKLCEKKIRSGARLYRY